uniref:Endonuclease/exonuclease/phosphatase domain-containing protein n=1 Tax=Cajanus cajan TaxID=3821 RepID=A0A151R2C2_CAJCA|nr:hypothetical protein KK1_042146 [Cajanus cajan]
MPDELLKKLWGNGDCNYAWSPAINAAVGLLTIWDPSKIHVHSQFSGSGFLGLIVMVRDFGDTMVLVNMYAPSEGRLKKRLWDELILCKENSPISLWCVAGDSNSVRSLKERVGLVYGMYATTDIEVYNNFIEQLELVDVPLGGRKFTWFRPNGTVNSRIDRILVSRSWFVRWPGVSQLVLNRGISDHCPILMRNKVVDWPQAILLSVRFFYYGAYFLV